MTKAVVELKNATKEYRGVPAIKNVNFKLYPGEIHALLGENGAGKSTLTKMMSGVVTPTKGQVIVDGIEVNYRSPIEALDNGIAMVFQETSLVPSLSVAQNLYLGTEGKFNRLRGLYISAQQFLQSLSFGVDPTMLVSQLGAAQKQMVEIARAVHRNAKVIIFDEPTATLTPEEKNHFFALAKRLQKQGVSIIFISHALEEALDIADRITILRDGEHVITDDADKFDRERIITHMVGRKLSEKIYANASKRVPRKLGKKILSVQNLSRGKMVRNSSFSVFSAQITGIFGLIGSGRTEMAKIISGVDKRNLFHGGEIYFEEEQVRFRVPRSAVKKGIVYVTEDRKAEGFFSEKSIAENIFSGVLGADIEKASVVGRSEILEVANEWSKLLNIKAINPNSKVVELSGGNQQKVVVAKSLVQLPKLVIFDEPTRGVDVGAIDEIYQIINKLADDGLAVVVISSYLPEIMNLSDRILIARQGRIVEEFRSNAVTEERIMYAAVH